MNDTNPSLVIAFLQGAKWWEYKSRGFTMWQSDQSDALNEAEKKRANGTLGVDKLERLQTKAQRTEGGA